MFNNFDFNRLNETSFNESAVREEIIVPLLEYLKIKNENINEETDDKNSTDDENSVDADEEPKIEIENIVDEYSKLREAVALVLPLYRVHATGTQTCKV